jgi:hypothetical protein
LTACLRVLHHLLRLIRVGLLGIALSFGKTDARL